jgi:hypothetical protein
MRDVTAAHPSSPLDDRLTEGWRSLAWGVISLGGLALGFAAVVVFVSYREVVTESGGDDSLAAVTFIIGATIGIACAVAVAVALAGLSFVRRWAPTPRKVLVSAGAAALALEILVVAYAFS